MMNEKLSTFLAEQNQRFEAVYKPVVLQNWMAATTGEKQWEELHEKSLTAYHRNFSEKEDFAKVIQFRKETYLTRLEQRQLDDLYSKMLPNQLDEKLVQETVALEKELSSKFNTFRPLLHGKKCTNNKILNILKKSEDSEVRKEAWLSSKQVGVEIEEKLLQLVHIRNENARALGYSDFYQMNLDVQDLKDADVFLIFERLKKVSDEPFRKVKKEIDNELAQKMNIDVKDLRPWHYADPFFQEAPAKQTIDIDKHFTGKNIEEVASATFEAVGLNIDDILKESDLYPRENKNPFGFCTNIDRQGDVRILVNIDESVFWTTALLHELGHASYFKNIDKGLPFLLRSHSHSITTEAIALFFGRMTKMSQWQSRFLGVEQKEQDTAMNQLLQRQLLVFARWVITFATFERELYQNPNQDLNGLWWKLAEEIQFINPPERTDYPDWASKMHFSLAPVTYQDYLLGELVASQLHHHIVTTISSDIFTIKVGEYFKDHIFKDGASFQWNELIENATGTGLDPTHFVNQFCVGWNIKS
ncbi:M3 family metallopeptidase [Sporosarcina aquimarina]|uniref:M3 family metallopeptidase n=1 Tax=Sporosarcina aquimarina TaxID=114975 RepID=A0ABU4FXI4_9BACL|nr:M3 family metallopeptidase [Sporosarcina aquimarina]MDW0109429.1 M3 family metallopeptidase [Sporosarcina aquimarina]